MLQHTVSLYISAQPNVMSLVNLCVVKDRGDTIPYSLKILSYHSHYLTLETCDLLVSDITTIIVTSQQCLSTPNLLILPKKQGEVWPDDAQC